MYKKYNRFLKIKVIKKKIKKWKKKEKKENSTELQKPNIVADFYNNNRKCDWIYTNTHTPILKIKTVQQK